MYPARIAQLERRKIKEQANRTAKAFGVCASLLFVGFAVIMAGQLYADPYRQGFWQKICWLLVNFIGVIAFAAGLFYFSCLGADLVRIIKAAVSLKRREAIRIKENAEKIGEEYERVFCRRSPR